ncbi:MAG: tetratricopeptide repeat protein, partial [Bacteroidales bacterium]|nr:tetratricopeptide repeat protein [Bacteroidales bacterium]
KANFYNREYDKALRSFRQIINQYKTENSRFEAQLWIAKVYIEQAKYQDALNYLTELENDVRHPKKLDQQINLTFADYYIRQKKYDQGIDRLKIGIDLTKNKNERARLYYILAQLENLRGDNNAASEYFKKVIKMNPNYDMVFSAKIMRATVFAVGQNSEEIKKQLRKMLKDEKNIEYKDQIYYALATIEFKENNLNEAIKNYKLSAQTSVSNNNQKAISFLALADIYFNKKDFLASGKYYDSTMQYLSSSYSDYDKIAVKAQNTGLLVQYLGEVQRQDSLQRVAAMPNGKRMALIDSIIADVIAKEQQMQDLGNNYYDPNDLNNNPNQSSQGGKWYMYNPVLVSRGQNDFKKKWGNRQIEDNWRRKNKSIVNQFDDPVVQQDVDSTRITDNKTREFYLQDLPLTDSLLEVSNNTIETSLFLGAEVYQKNLKEPQQAILTYEELTTRFSTSHYKLETFYRLYNLNKQIGNQNRADYYKQLITIQFPDSKYSKMLIDPNFVNQLMISEKFALKLFDSTLNSYNNNNYNNTILLANKGISKYPNSQAYPNFLFFKAKAYGNIGNTDSLTYYLTLVSTKYKGTDLANLSTEILAMQQSGIYDYNIYSQKPNEEHYIMILIEKSQNTTVFKFKLKNTAEQFTNTRTFTLDDTTFNSQYSIVNVKYFINEQEAIDFKTQLLNSDVFADIPTDKYYLYFISKTNYATFENDKVLDKYQYFFNKTYTTQVQ